MEKHGHDSELIRLRVEVRPVGLPLHGAVRQSNVLVRDASEVQSQVRAHEQEHPAPWTISNWPVVRAGGKLVDRFAGFQTPDGPGIIGPHSREDPLTRENLPKT